MRFPDARILIFAKAPIPGQVKTRLIPRLGEEGAARLYAGLLQRIVAELGDGGLCPVQCWCAPDTRHKLFTELAARHGVSLERQSGADLGARMFHAACVALGDSDRVILVGADCPGLGVDYLGLALDRLEEGVDAVLGPAEDGGYVLLGLKRAAPQLFEDMPWGTGEILAATRHRLRELGWQWRELRALWDVDRPEDLQRLDRHIRSLYRI